MLDRTTETAAFTDAVSGAEILAICERVERLHEERKGIADDISDVFAEAKGRGLDVKILKLLIKERAQDPAARSETETILDLYREAVSRART